ncbi:MAG: hypothetical protein QOC69_1240 [Mycobacterium sp.]|jgi:NAD(P)-dependent dehydrogenase (short-subunit alcohol dehydrogenase family)|nr:hypothetical protein [Mycobacterium sp.]
MGPANDVVDEIIAAGGEAVANRDDIADWAGASSLIQTALDTYGGLDVLVNNAGFIRGGDLADTSEAEWDAVVRVHLKGHFATLRHATRPSGCRRWGQRRPCGPHPARQGSQSASPTWQAA